MATILVCLIGVIPAFSIWLAERFKRRLSESRLAIAQSVTSMEQLMLQREVTIGDVSHDVLFSKMASVQNTDTFSINWSMFQRRQKHVEEVRDSLLAELESEECKFRHVVHSFSCHYFRAFKFKHPVVCTGYVLWLFTLASGLGGLVLVLQAFLAVLKGVQALEQAVRNIRDYTANTFTALSFDKVDKVQLRKSAA